MKIAIVGGGIMGLCTARAFTLRGHEVTLFEQHGSGNPYGSSHGRTRIVRQAYPDQFYTEILLKGHGLWHDLEHDTGQKLIHEVGLLFVANKDEAELHHELESLENLGVPHRIHTSETIRQVHSHMVLQAEEIAVMTLSAGWADVPLILNSLQTFNEARGVKVARERVTNLNHLERFDKVIVTAGAWVTKFFDLPVEVTLQTFAYVDKEMSGPVWIEGFGDHLYGFPSEPLSSTAKVGFHTLGPVTDPDTIDRVPQADALTAIKQGAARRFGIADPQIVETSCCLYSTAPNDDFKIGWANENTLVASPCSGHGFKFGPWIGSFLADLVEEKEDIRDWPRFWVRF